MPNPGFLPRYPGRDNGWIILRGIKPGPVEAPGAGRLLHPQVLEPPGFGEFQPCTGFITDRNAPALARLQYGRLCVGELGLLNEGFRPLRTTIGLLAPMPPDNSGICFPAAQFGAAMTVTGAKQCRWAGSAPRREGAVARRLLSRFIIVPGGSS